MRQKTVFETNEIAHLWMHKAQPSATNRRHNFYFEGDTIYSYGSHFPIARHADSANGPAVLLTTAKYSVTTSAHIGDVCRAIPEGTTIFRVSNPSNSERYQMLSFRDLVFAARKALDSAKTKPQTALRYRVLQSAIANANDFAEWGGFRERYKLPASAAELEANASDYDAALEMRRRAADARRSAQWKAQRERDEQKAREFAKKQPELITAWKRGEDVPDLKYHLYELPVMLRIVGEEIETSKGARFPVEHARRALPLICKVWESGQDWHTNGHTIHLGAYQIDRIDASGVVAGCHVVSRAEVERVAALIEEQKGETS